MYFIYKYVLYIVVNNFKNIKIFSRFFYFFLICIINIFIVTK